MWFISSHTPFSISPQVTMIWHWTKDYGSVTKFHPVFHSSFFSQTTAKGHLTGGIGEFHAYIGISQMFGVFQVSIIKRMYLIFLTFRTESSVPFRYRDTLDISEVGRDLSPSLVQCATQTQAKYGLTLCWVTCPNLKYQQDRRYQLPLTCQ